MLRFVALLSVFLLGPLTCVGAQDEPKSGPESQDAPKPIDQNDPRLMFSFPIQKGGEPLRFRVLLDKGGRISGVSVFRMGSSRPFQTLQGCSGFADEVDENWGWGDLSKLISHADFNFDGFQDLELLTNFIPHLDKKLYCIFLWNAKSDRFVYSKELSENAANLEAHPENRTLTTQDDWQGGAWESSTYRWKGSKLELIEQSGLYGDWSMQTAEKCGFTFSCSRLVNGEMVTTLERPVCTEAEMEHVPACPSPARPSRTGTPDSSSSPPR